MNVKLAIEALGTTGHLILNKKLIKEFGLVKAGILSNYIDKYQYFSKRNEFDGWFYLTHSDIMEQLGLKEGEVIKVKTELIKEELIMTKMSGVPAKQFIQINFTKILNILFPNQLLGGLDPLKTGGLDLRDEGGLYIRKTNSKEVLRRTSLKNASGDKITLDDFDKFWELYPSSRRGSKGKAQSIWIKLCTPNNVHRPDWQRVRAAILKQKKSEQWQKESLIPLSTTWLNQYRWLDDPKELKNHKFVNGFEAKQEQERDELYLEQERRRKTKELEEAMRHE
jgi:hypothetical protein